MSNQSDKPFNFPFQPYDIQLKFMQVAYDTFEQSKFALLESPTGTGKSLSLVCSALSWLNDYNKKTKQTFEDEKADLSEKIEKLKLEEDSGTIDWLDAQTVRQEYAKKLIDVDKALDVILKFEQKSEARRAARIHDDSLDNYAVFGKKARDKENQAADPENEASKVLHDLKDGDQLDDEDVNIEEKIKEHHEVDEVKPKIYYASRTHSQLTQFVNEVKKTKFASSDLDSIPIKLTTLASRANLCVNPDVLKLKEPHAINERCAELQREKNADNRCPYVKSSQVIKLKEDILATVRDIEDTVTRGKAIGACPYYAARMSVPEAELVVLPYNNLLHHETRKASALDLKENIVIIDEAHNILETICSIHSAPISGEQLIGSHSILSRYYHRFHARMNPRNAEIILATVQCITALLRYLNDAKSFISNIEQPQQAELAENPNKVPLKRGSSAEVKRDEELMLDVSKFVAASQIAPFNIFKILDYFNRSQLARKLLGVHRQDTVIDLSLEIYGLAQSVKEPTDTTASTDSPQTNPTKKRKTAKESASKTKPIPVSKNDPNSTNLVFLKDSNTAFSQKQPVLVTGYPIYTLIEFFRALTNLSQDGKILTNLLAGDIQKSGLKFILLNPSSQFKQMTEEARSIILAGGTMQPFSEFTDLLFGPLGIDGRKTITFSCGHVVEQDHIFVAALSVGPNSRPLELSFKTRSSFDTIDEIGRTVANIANVVPGGMVCFLPSYDYEQFCYNRWKHVGIIGNIETRSKQVFREPRKTSHLKPILDEFSRVVIKHRGTKRGALLLCVVGGKMSEGINFNDDLGRCVVVIGLPYANIKSSELQQKMQYYEKSCKTGAGQMYYENLCLKGINQSIGRAIRHKNDYAAIILLDQRYSSKATIRQGLAGWMRKSLGDYDKFGPMFGKLTGFFRNAEQKFKPHETSAMVPDELTL